MRKFMNSRWTSMRHLGFSCMNDPQDLEPGLTNLLLANLREAAR